MKSDTLDVKVKNMEGIENYCFQIIKLKNIIDVDN